MQVKSTTQKAVGKALGVLGVAVGLGAVGTLVVRRMRRRFGDPVRQAITVGRPRDDVYAFWRKLEHLPEFMKWVASVEQRDNNISHWTVKTIGDVEIEYDAEIIDDVPGRRIGWRTTQDATVPLRGNVEFRDAPGDRGTEIVVEMQVAAPLAKTIVSKEVAADLHRLKQILELGEVVHSDASIHKGKHPAQPSEGGLQ